MGRGDLARLLRSSRKARQLSLIQLCRELGLPTTRVGTLSRLENARLVKVDKDLFQLLSRFYHFPENHLVEEFHKKSIPPENTHSSPREIVNSTDYVTRAAKMLSREDWTLIEHLTRHLMSKRRQETK